jgi:hypothetical protein
LNEKKKKQKRKQRSNLKIWAQTGYDQRTSGSKIGRLTN